jgi:hypothetical protein
MGGSPGLDAYSSGRWRRAIWRVYEVASSTPKIKRFPDPVRLLGARQQTLDLGDLKANIEGLG